MNRVVEKCPVCAEDLTITRLRCDHCETEISGAFRTSSFCRLSEEDLAFAEMFIRLRGNVREMEREMGIAYNAVRNRLDEVIRRLASAVAPAEKPDTPEPKAADRRQVLDRLERGEIEPEEVIRLLGGEANESEESDE